MLPFLPFRHPLLLLIAAELIVVAALGALGWHLLHAGPAPPAGGGFAAVAVPPVATGAAGRPPLAPNTPAGPAAASPLPAPAPGGPSPGLATGRAFVKGQMGSIDRDQALLLRAEWRVLDAFSAAAQRYLKEVVIPTVERAAAEPGA